MTNITFNVESWTQCRPELEPFVEPHWRELGLDHQDVPVSLAWDVYEQHEQQGILHLVTVRDSGTLIGYVSALIVPMLHYASTRHSITDLYYLKPEYRKDKIGVNMLLYAETCYRELGVVKIITGTKLHLNHSKLFESLGYRPTEITFTKVLK